MPGTGLVREVNCVLRFLWSRVMPHMVLLLRLVRTPRESAEALARMTVEFSHRFLP